jgi:hypothetical protein
MFVNELLTCQRNEESSNFSRACKEEMVGPSLWVGPPTLPFTTLKLLSPLFYNLL